MKRVLDLLAALRMMTTNLMARFRDQKISVIGFFNVRGVSATHKVAGEVWPTAVGQRI